MGIEIHVYNEQTNIWVTLWQSKKTFFYSFFFQDWDLRISWPPVSLDFTIIWLLLGQSIIFLHLLHHICHGIHATMISTQNVSFKIISYIFLSSGQLFSQKIYCFAKYPYDFNGKFGNWVFLIHTKIIKSIEIRFLRIESYFRGSTALAGDWCT